MTLKTSSAAGNDNVPRAGRDRGAAARARTPHGPRPTFESRNQEIKP